MGLQVAGKQICDLLFPGCLSLAQPSPATGAEELDPALSSTQEVVLTRLHLCLWEGLALVIWCHCPFSDAGVLLGADWGHDSPVAPFFVSPVLEGQHD